MVSNSWFWEDEKRDKTIGLGENEITYVLRENNVVVVGEISIERFG